MAVPVQVILESSGVKPTSTKDDNLDYHLHHLLAVDISALHDTASLKNVSTQNCQLLLNKIFELPTESHSDGMMAILPEDDTILPTSTFRFPRSMPLPKEKPKSRWDKFAKEKGIEKRKRSRLVWDEVKKDWVPRWGHKSVKKNAEAMNWLIEGSGKEANMLGSKHTKKTLLKGLKQHNDGGKGKASKVSERIIIKGKNNQKGKIISNPTEDPFDAQGKTKQVNTAKQKLREIRNQLEAQQKFKGKTRKMFTQQMGNINQMASNNLQTGVPILNKNVKHSNKSPSQLKEIMGKAQRSTASFGRHDRKAALEKEVKKKRRIKVEAVSVEKERQKYQKTLSKMLKQNA